MGDNLHVELKGFLEMLFRQDTLRFAQGHKLPLAHQNDIVSQLNYLIEIVKYGYDGEVTLRVEFLRSVSSSD